MASKRTVTLHNVAALGPERLAAILVDLAEADVEVKRRLRLELAAQAGGDSIAAEIGKRITALKKARSFIDWQKRRDFVKDLDLYVTIFWLRNHGAIELKGSEKQARYRTRRKGIVPEQCDIDRVDAQHGRLPRGAPIEQQAERYRLYQAQALIRLWESGQLPLEQMRALDALAAKRGD